jgi:hypothetical protein
MKLYCHIEKTISKEGAETFIIKEGPGELPENSSTVSNLNLLDDITLQLFGWVPVEQITENKPIFVSISYEIFEDKVIQTIITRDKTEEELAQEKTTQNAHVWQALRDKRDKALQESDKLVMIDRWEKLSYEEKDTISVYRQELRDLPAQNSDPNLIVFPIL